MVAFDEFTSVVDRTVAKVCSAAIAKGIRQGHIPCRFVAVTCHYDVAEWLEPDWVLDMATGEMDTYIARRYTIPLPATPAHLVQLCVDITLYRLALSQDVATVEAAALFAVFVSVSTQIVGDLGYMMLNPRIRFS